MKNEKGITLMILVATIVIMAIIIGSVSYHSISGFKMSAYYDMCSDIELLDEKIAIYYLENKDKAESLPITSERIQIEELIEGYDNQNVNYNSNNSGNLCKIDLNKLDNLSLKNSEYYIDEQSHIIYSLIGQKLGDDTYYTSLTNVTSE